MGSIENALTWLMNQVGYAICHQFPERSLAYGNRALPVCTRDTGVFLAFAVCFVALMVAYGSSPRSYPSWPKLAFLAAFILPTIVDAVTSYTGIRESSNAIRLVTGAFAGTGLAALVFPLAVTRLEKRPVEEEDRIPPVVFQSWWSLALLLFIPAAVSLALVPDWPGAYWLWAPLVSLSIIFALLVLNFTLVSLVLDRVRGERRIPGTAALAGIAFIAAVVEIVVSNRLHWFFRGRL